MTGTVGYTGSLKTLIDNLITGAKARANHTGTQSADTLVDGTTNKAFLATERTKLAGVATGATANRTDAATDSAISTAITGLVNAAPTALDTLGEIATQLGSDENAAAALTILVGQKTFGGTTNTVAANGALTASRPNAVDATSGPLTVTLPTPAVAGQLLSVEKTDATSNTVTVSGTIRGATSTIVMYGQYEARIFEAESLTSWRPIADHRTKTALDATYATRGYAPAAVRTVPAAGVPALSGFGHYIGNSGTNAFIDGTNRIFISQYQHQVLADITDLRFLFGNFAGYEAPGASITSGDATNSITVGGTVYIGCTPNGITGRTLAANIALNDTTIKLNSVAGIGIGARIRVNFAQMKEFRVTAVDTINKLLYTDTPSGYAYTTANNPTITILPSAHRLRFNGALTTTIGISGLVASDPIGIYLPKGSLTSDTYPTIVYTRTWADAGAGGRVPGGRQANLGQVGEGVLLQTADPQVTVTDAAITSGTKVISFTSTTVLAGWVGLPVVLSGATSGKGYGGSNDLYATIASVDTAANTITLTAAQNTSTGNAENTVSGQTLKIGDYLDPNITASISTAGTPNGYHPIVAVGTAAATSKVLGVAGDSKATSDSRWPNMWAMQNGWPYVNMARVGDQAQMFARHEYRLRRSVLLNYATTVLCEYGINDLGTGIASDITRLETNLFSIWRVFAAAGQRVLQATLTPYTTSTDSWATATNQTPTAGNPTRVAVNTWLRAGAPIDPTLLVPVAVGTSGALVAGATGHPLYGIQDVAAAVEVDSTNTLTQNGGRWIANGTANYATNDGLHEQTGGTTLILATLNSAQVA